MKALFRGFCRNENGKGTIWLNGEEVKGDWLQGSLEERIIEYPDREEIECRIQEMHIGIGEDGIPVYQSGFDESVIPETVSEAVRGLTDKNGRQVFEGDKGKDRYGHIYEVVYNEKTGGFEVWTTIVVGAYGEKATRKLNFAQVEGFEVIGTKWDKGE